MNGNAHKAIAEAAMKIVRPDLNSLLNEKISKKNWDLVRKKSQSTIEKEIKAIGKEVDTYWDLFVLGAVVEDYTELASDIDEPEYQKSSLGRLLQSYDGGEYQHWLEHFWNTDMTDDHNSVSKKCGFKFTHDYICQIVSELIGADYFLKSGSIVLSKIDKILINPLALIAESAIRLCYGGDQVFDRYRSAPNRAQRYWDELIDQYKRGEKERAIFNLGKVCHLLADVGTPAHMHGDGHCDNPTGGWVSQIIAALQFHSSGDTKQDGLDDDEYESYTSRIIEENRGKLPSDWDVNSDYGPIYKQDWNLFSFFEDLGDYSRRFDSDDCDGTGHGKPYRWEHFDYLTSIANAIFLQETGLQRQTNDDLTEYACNAIAIQLIPLTIRYTAGILYLFAKTVGLKVQGLDSYSVTFDKIEVHDDTDPFGSGELYFSLEVGKQEHRLRFDANSGDTIYLKKRKINPDDIKFIENISNNTSLHVHTEGEDNDDWWFLVKIKESESLGFTNKTLNISDINHEHENKYEEKSSNGKYTIHYSIEYEGREEFGEIQCEDTALEQLQEMKLSRYKEGENLRMQPLNVNFDTMHLHLSSLKHKPCQIGKKAKGRTVTFYQNDDELFKPKRINSKLYIDRFNKMLDLGEKWLDDPKFKNQLRDIPELEKLDKTEFRNQIKLIREEINNNSFQKKFKDFCKKSDTEYQIVTEQILKLDKEESFSNTETPKWACSNEKEFYRAFSTECQCCKDKKTKSALERKIRAIEKEYPDLKER